MEQVVFMYMSLILLQIWSLRAKKQADVEVPLFTLNKIYILYNLLLLSLGSKRKPIRRILFGNKLMPGSLSYTRSSRNTPVHLSCVKKVLSVTCGILILVFLDILGYLWYSLMINNSVMYILCKGLVNSS